MEDDLQLNSTLSSIELVTVHEWDAAPLEPILESLIHADMEETK